MRVTAWVRRFIRNASTPGSGARGKGPRTWQSTAKRLQLELDPDEIVLARRQLIVLVQGEAYSDELRTLRSFRDVAKGSYLYRLVPFVDDRLIRVNSRLHMSDL